MRKMRAPYFMDIKHDWRVEFGEGQDTGFSAPPDAVRTLFTRTRQPISRTKTLGTQRHTATLTSGTHEPDHKIQAPTFQLDCVQGGLHLNSRHRKLPDVAPGSSGRILVIKDDQAAFDLYKKLRRIYGSFGYLLRGTVFVLEIAQAYEDIEATEAVEVDGVALRWNETSFKKEPYDQIRKRFGDILSRMPDGEDVAVMVLPQPSKGSIPQAPGNKGKAREAGEATYEDDLATEAIEMSHGESSTSKAKQKSVSIVLPTGNEEVDSEGNPASRVKRSASRGKRKEPEGSQGCKHKKAKQT
ncbi:hypothetical protein C0995_007428 [Termitomyces sp. Mi166|nr:hypothetical protein C0995_007428 [Termitomyces sp. Mi166\